VALLLLVAARAAGSAAAATAVTPHGKKSPTPGKTSTAVLATDTQRTAAEALLHYLGTGARNKGVIAKLQHTMGAIASDGVVGSRTRSRVESLLGHQVLWPKDIFDALSELKTVLVQFQDAGTKPAAESSAESASATAPKKLRAAPSKKSNKSPASAPKPTAASPAQSADDATQAAQDLHTFVASGGRDRATVASFQRRLNLDPDGIVGPSTRARVDTVLGAQSWPTDAGKPVGAAPAPADPRSAASELRNYLATGGKRKDRVRAYQEAMGGVKADGVAGAKTKARIAELLGD
jgi:peptidoglycan hydrolase-like protein with peptidoglycan-binding domain